MGLQESLVVLARFVGGFFSTLASNGSSVALPALGLLGQPEHMANGTNRLSVVALGLVGTVHFARLGLIDWREGARVALLIAVGTVAGSYAAVDLSNAALDVIVTAGLLLVLALLLSRPGRWLEGKGEPAVRPRPDPRLPRHRRLRRPGRPRLRLLHARRAGPAHGLRPETRVRLKAFVLLVVGLQSLVVLADKGEVDWSAGIPLTLGSAAGAYVAARLASSDRARVWVYRFLVLVVVLSVAQLLVVDGEKYLQHT